MIGTSRVLNRNSCVSVLTYIYIWINIKLHLFENHLRHNYSSFSLRLVHTCFALLFSHSGVNSLRWEAVSSESLMLHVRYEGARVRLGLSTAIHSSGDTTRGGHQETERDKHQEQRPLPGRHRDLDSWQVRDPLCCPVWGGSSPDTHAAPVRLENPLLSSPAYLPFWQKRPEP